MATIFRPPVVTRIPRRGPVLSVLAAEDAVRSNRLLDLLKSQDAFFGAPGMGPDYDYPNPRGRVPAISLRTWVWSYNLNLIGADQFFGPAGVGPVYDYPNPRQRLGAIGLRTWDSNLLQTTLAPSGAVLIPWALLESGSTA